MMVFFCGNAYKNTLQNVTANRRIFFEFSNENPEKNGKNEMNIRDIFVFTSATIPRKMYGYMKGILSHFKFIFKRGCHFAFKMYG